MLPLEVTCQDVKARLDAGENFLLLDCREEDEHQLVNIPSAELIPMSGLMARAGELEPHRDRTIVVLCHLGGRSMQVTHWLRQRGFAHAQNMSGGIDQWAVEIEPGMARY